MLTGGGVRRGGVAIQTAVTANDSWPGANLARSFSCSLSFVAVRPYLVLMKGSMMGYLWVALGGVIGAVSRYALSGWINDWLGPGPLAIFIVNVSGSFLIGFITAVTQDRFIVDPNVRLLITVGVLGAYTTFSTWMYETLQLLESGDYLRATTNAFGSLAVGLIAVYIGTVAGRLV
jgi:CrcB protein